MCIRRTLKEFKLECPACRAPAKEEDLRPNHALEDVVAAYKAARTRLLAVARRVDDPTPKAVAAPPGREVATKRNKRGGANNDRARVPDCAPPAKRATRRTSRDIGVAKSVTPAVETRKATRSSARATGGAEASTSGGGAWGRPVRASRRSAAPVPPPEDDTADEEDEDDEGEAGDLDYGETQEDDEDDDVVSESDLETDVGERDEVVDLVDDEGGGGGCKSKRKLGGRQPSAPSTTPGGSDDTKRPGTVQCPICGVGVQEGLINSHVDVCLTRGGAFGSAIAEAVGGYSSPKDEFGNENSDEQYAMAKLPKLVYHIMKDKPLRKLLSDAGLSAVGRRDQLIDRHKEFTLRVNASIDSGHKPNLVAIAKEVSKLERDRDRAGMMSAPGLIGSGGSGLAAAVPPASKADVFGKLIADVRTRDGAGTKARRNLSSVEDREDIGDERDLQGHADTVGDEGDVRVQEQATKGGVEA